MMAAPDAAEPGSTCRGRGPGLYGPTGSGRRYLISDGGSSILLDLGQGAVPNVAAAVAPTRSPR